MNRQKIWECTGNDQRKMPEQIWKEDISILSDAKKMMEAELIWKKVDNRKEIVLPLIQNLESVALGADIIKTRGYWTTGDYPFSNLEEIDLNRISIIKDKRIQAVIECIRQLRHDRIILEVEAPFSILASLVNPMELYESMQTKPDLLNDILKKIAMEEKKYLEAVIDAGCTIISLAEPIGTIDMVGEEYFKKFSGKAVVFLLKQTRKFLKNSVIHLCGKLSGSMLVADMAEEIICTASNEEYFENLLEAARNPKIYFTGQHCIHQKKNLTGKIHVISLKEKIRP